MQAKLFSVGRRRIGLGGGNLSKSVTLLAMSWLSLGMFYPAAIAQESAESEQPTKPAKLVDEDTPIPAKSRKSSQETEDKDWLEKDSDVEESPKIKRSKKGADEPGAESDMDRKNSAFYKKDEREAEIKVKKPVRIKRENLPGFDEKDDKTAAILRSPEGPDPSTLDPEPYFKRAVALTNEKNYQAALGQLRQALKLNPHYYEAKYQAALIYQLMGYNKHAKLGWERFLAVRPDHLQAHINFGTLKKSMGDYKGAEAEFRKAIDLKHTSFEAHYNLANLLVQTGQLDESLKEYKVCLKLSPKDAKVHNNLGVIYQSRKYFEEAQEEYRQALALDPTNKVYQNNLAMVRKLMKKPVGA